jgi:chromosome segregation ATPase
MTTIAINLTLIEFIVLPLVMIIFACTLSFFLKNHKSLQETLQASKKAVTIKKEKEVVPKRTTLVELEEQFAKMRHEILQPKTEQAEAPLKKLKKEETGVQELKNTIAQQQKILEDYLQRVEELENEGKEELNQNIEELEIKVSELYAVIEEKEEEIKELQKEASAGYKMSSKIDDVYKEIEQLQTKMKSLEKQAGRANNLAIELEDTKYDYEQVHKELLRKHEKLEEIMQENEQMRREMNELEDKLAEANLQRQQLSKKVQFLTELNNDMQSIADTNKKLQTELRRIGELESMLDIMTEEREYLLKKRNDK